MRPLVLDSLRIEFRRPFSRMAKAEVAFGVVHTARSTQLHLYAPISVNGSKPVWFAVDTGAPISLISPTIRRALSLPTGNSPEIASLIGRNPAIPIVYARSVKALDMELGPGYFVQTSIQLVLASERTWQARIPFDKEGLIGMNFLLKHGAVINCRTQQIFFSREGTKLPLRREVYERMGFTYLPIRITPRNFAEVEGSVLGSTYIFVHRYRRTRGDP
jgi:Aspartyl protease